MRLFFCFFALCHVLFGTVLSYDIQDFEAIRQSAVRNIVSLENILEHRLAGATHRAHHKAPKSRRIGGNIVMG